MLRHAKTASRVITGLVACHRDGVGGAPRRVRLRDRSKYRLLLRWYELCAEKGAGRGVAATAVDHLQEVEKPVVGCSAEAELSESLALEHVRVGAELSRLFPERTVTDGGVTHPRAQFLMPRLGRNLTQRVGKRMDFRRSSREPVRAHFALDWCRTGAVLAVCHQAAAVGEVVARRALKPGIPGTCDNRERADMDVYYP